ncbi:NEP1-interacting protein 1 [Gossypium raimondii]|nr:NEP1-interacting protein 1 [Gossypium raimondii]
MLKELFIGITEVPFRCAEEVSLWVLAAMKDVGIGFLIEVGFAAFSFVFALETIVGAMKGQTTETGLFNGAGLGAVAGAITAVQLLESLADGELLSQVSLLVRLVSQKVFIARVNSAMLKAFQWEMNIFESTYTEISNICDVDGAKGLSRSWIQKLPMHEIQSSPMFQSSCSICLQGLKDGEMARNLPRCEHMFHLNCIDEWLSRVGTCPMCRDHVF